MSADILQNQTLAKYTSWQIGGPAEYLALPRSMDDLYEILNWAQSREIPIHTLGGGSNILVSDQGVEGLTLCLKDFSSVFVREEEGRLCIYTLAGTSKTEILKVFLKYKLAPSLFLAGLPGDVGGGVVMNAGISENLVPREFVEIVDWVEVIKLDDPDLSPRKYSKEDLNWGYRHCTGWEPGIITRVGMSWPVEPDESVLEKVRELNRTRHSKQPLDMPSCGSVFVNPTGHKAAQLIDQSGLKGFQIGGAQVSLKHANFIVNTGGAKASDVDQVIKHVQATVKEKAGVDLKTEVIYFGKW